MRLRFPRTPEELPCAHAGWLAVKEITHFSYDNAHRLRHDPSSLKTYYTPELGASLSRGFETFVKHDDSVDEHLDGLLEALVELERKTGERTKADIVTWRGMMTKVCSALQDDFSYHSDGGDSS